MGLSVVNRTQGGVFASGGDYTAPVQNNAAGNLLVVLITDQAATNVTGVTDTAGNLFVQAGSEQGPATTNYFNIYYAKNILGTASNQVTVHLAGASTYRTVVVYEISGADLTNPLNTTSWGFGIDTSFTTGVIPLVAAEEIICAIMIQLPTISGGPGYTLVNWGLAGDPTAYVADEYHITSASEAATASTSGVSSEYGIFAASFKAATGFPSQQIVGPFPTFRPDLLS